MEATAVVVTVTGDFTFTTAHVPNNAKPPSVPVMFLVLDARTGRVEMRGIKALDAGSRILISQIFPQDGLCPGRVLPIIEM